MAQTPLAQSSLGTGFPLALSRDGNIALVSNAGSYSYWTKATGLVPILGGTVTAYHFADGGVSIPGRAVDPFGAPEQVPSVYNIGSGTWFPLGTLPGAVPSAVNGYGEARVATPDGQVVAGKATDANKKGQAFRWTVGTGLVGLNHNGGQSMVTVLSNDGSVMGGWDEDPLVGTPNAALWDAAGNISYPLVSAANPTGRGYIRAMSGDGAYFAGDDINGAFLVGPSGYVSLGAMFGTHASSCLSMSERGELVTGVEWVPSGPFSTKPNYWFWTAATGLVSADALLAAHGFQVPIGGSHSQFTALSRDGSKLLGSFSVGGGTDIYHVALPTHFEDLGGPLAGTFGDPALSADGTTLPGFPVTLNLANALPNSFAFLAIASGASSVPLFGGTLQAFPPQLLLTLPTGATGGFALPSTWPASAVGGTLVLQAGIVDAGAIQGVALTNALKVVGL